MSFVGKSSYSKSGYKFFFLLHPPLLSGLWWTLLLNTKMDEWQGEIEGRKMGNEGRNWRLALRWRRKERWGERKERWSSQKNTTHCLHPAPAINLPNGSCLTLSHTHETTHTGLHSPTWLIPWVMNHGAEWHGAAQHLLEVVFFSWTDSYISAFFIACVYVCTRDVDLDS